VPTHPDRVGGLGFLANASYAYSVLAVALGALLAGQLADRIFFLGATLTQFKAEIAGLVGVLLCTFLGPLLVFSAQLAQAKRKGLREYGTLAERYVREFDVKWLRVAPLPMSRSWAAVTSNRSPIWGTATRWCEPCTSRR